MYGNSGLDWGPTSGIVLAASGGVCGRRAQVSAQRTGANLGHHRLSVLSNDYFGLLSYVGFWGAYAGALVEARFAARIALSDVVEIRFVFRRIRQFAVDQVEFGLT